MAEPASTAATVSYGLSIANGIKSFFGGGKSSPAFTSGYKLSGKITPQGNFEGNFYTLASNSKGGNYADVGAPGSAEKYSAGLISEYKRLFPSGGPEIPVDVVTGYNATSTPETVFAQITNQGLGLIKRVFESVNLQPIAKETNAVIQSPDAPLNDKFVIYSVFGGLALLLLLFVLWGKNE